MHFNVKVYYYKITIFVVLSDKKVQKQAVIFNCDTKTRTIGEQGHNYVQIQIRLLFNMPFHASL